MNELILNEIFDYCYMNNITKIQDITLGRDRNTKELTFYVNERGKDEFDVSWVVPQVKAKFYVEFMDSDIDVDKWYQVYLLRKGKLERICRN